MTDIYRRRGRKPIAAALVVRALRSLQHRSEPITTSLLQAALPDLPRSSLLRSLQWLQAEAGLLIRPILGTNVREYRSATRSAEWGVRLDPDVQRQHARAETTLLVLLSEWERK